MLYKDKTSKVACVICNGYEPKEVFHAISKAATLINASSVISLNGSVLIKPNLCLLVKPGKAITTHPEVVKKTAEWCSAYNKNIIVGDSPVGDADQIRINDIWETSGIKDAMDGLTYSRIFFEADLIEYSCNVNGRMCKYFMSKKISEIRTIINLPKFKTHSLMTYTGAVKNLYGLLPGKTKRKLHDQFPVKSDFAAFLVELYLQIKPNLNIVDAVVCLEGDGPGTGGHPRKLNLIMASEDALALDFIAAKIMNIDPETIPTNAVAMKKGLLKEEEIEIVGDQLENFIQYDFKIPQTVKYTPDLVNRLFEISRPMIKVNSNKCTCCELCMLSCPVNCIKIAGGTAKIDKKKCIFCMTCHEICPNAAIKIREPDFYKSLKERRHIDNK